MRKLTQLALVILFALLTTLSTFAQETEEWDPTPFRCWAVTTVTNISANGDTTFFGNSTGIPQTITVEAEFLPENINFEEGSLNPHQFVCFDDYRVQTPSGGTPSTMHYYRALSESSFVPTSVPDAMCFDFDDTVMNRDNDNYVRFYVSDLDLVVQMPVDRLVVDDEEVTDITDIWGLGGEICSLEFGFNVSIEVESWNSSDGDEYYVRWVLTPKRAYNININS